MAKKKPRYPNRNRNIFICIAVTVAVVAALAGIGLYNNARSGHIFTLDGAKTPTREYSLYMFNQRVSYEYQLGSDVWGYGTGESSFYDLARSSALATLVNTKVVYSKVNELGISVTAEDKAEAKATAENFLTSVSGEQHNEFLRALKATRAQLDQMMLESLMVDRVFDHLTADFPIDEADLASEYALYLETEKSNYLIANVNYIQTEQLSTAKEILAQLSDGGDFFALIEEYSDAADPSAPVSLASLGVSSEILQAAFDMEPGTVSDFEEVPDGYIIFMLDEVVEPDYDELDTWFRDGYISNEKQNFFADKCDEWREAAEFVLNEYAYDNTPILGLEQYHQATLVPVTDEEEDDAEAAE